MTKCKCDISINVLFIKIHTFYLFIHRKRFEKAKKMRLPSHRWMKYRWILPTFIFVCLSLSGYLLFPRLSLLNSDQTITNDETGTKTHKILVWHWPFGNSFNLDGDFCKDKFRVPNCIMMDNQSRLSEADIVIFHNRELIQYQQRLPVNLKRPEKQR